MPVICCFKLGQICLEMKQTSGPIYQNSGFMVVRCTNCAKNYWIGFILNFRQKQSQAAKNVSLSTEHWR